MVNSFDVLRKRNPIDIYKFIIRSVDTHKIRMNANKTLWSIDCSNFATPIGWLSVNVVMNIDFNLDLELKAGKIKHWLGLWHSVLCDVAQHNGTLLCEQ